jgi:hypothetical protein
MRIVTVRAAHAIESPVHYLYAFVVASSMAAACAFVQL